MDKVLEVQRDIKQNAGEVQDFLKVCSLSLYWVGSLETSCLACLFPRVLDPDLYGTELISIAESKSALF
jgi:hypothetical protein